MPTRDDGASSGPYIERVILRADRARDEAAFPFTIPAVRHLDGLELGAVTCFVGENGSGKSTILEALAVAAGFNAEGGSANMRFATRTSDVTLADHLRLSRRRRPRTGFFLRAESFFNVATQIEELGVGDSYGERSLHEQSHGESFLALANHRFGPAGLYLLDEPEAALSPVRQMSLLVRIHHLVAEHSQFILATHSPILMAYPGALIYRFDGAGIARVAYDDVEHVNVTRDFLNHRDLYLQRLFRAVDESRDDDDS